MKIPSTEDSLFDGSRQYHQFTDPLSSTFFEVLPSSPPAQDEVTTMQLEDEDTDMDTDVDDPELQKEQETTITAHQRTLRTMSNAAKAVARRSLSFEPEVDTFVRRVIENPQGMIDSKGVLTVNFEGAGLHTLPDDFSDLQMVTPQPNQTMVFMGKNYLQSLPSYIFDMSSITVLSLRDNMLDILPPAIMKLRNLTELHVGGNNLRWLPFELTQLPLTTLTLTPNPLIKPKNDTSTDMECSEEYYMSDQCSSLAHMAMAKYIEHTYPQHLPRLADHLQLEITKQQSIQNQCSLCSSVYIHEAAAIMRWYNIFRQANVPLKLSFCTTNCYLKFAFPQSSDRV